MKHNTIGITILTVILSSLIFTGCSKLPKYEKVEGFAQGGTYHIIYSTVTKDGKDLPVSTDSINNMISQKLIDIDFTLSGYNKSSILTKVNAGEDVELNDMFIELFEISRKINEETDGFFDISGGPLFDFWGFGFKNPDKLLEMQNSERTKTVIDSLLQFTGMDKVYIENNKLVKKDPRVILNFNAIAQGYTCDKIAELLEEYGIGDFLVEVGMEIMCKGKNASGKPWRIGIDKPIDGSEVAGENIQEILDVTDCGIVTSGNYRKFQMIDGKKYAHSIDPHTGYPVQHDLLSATVIAENSALADAYATYCMVVGKEKATEFIKSHDGLKAYLICSDEIIKLF